MTLMRLRLSAYTASTAGAMIWDTCASPHALSASRMAGHTRAAWLKLPCQCAIGLCQLPGGGNNVLRLMSRHSCLPQEPEGAQQSTAVVC